MCWWRCNDNDEDDDDNDGDHDDEESWKKYKRKHFIKKTKTI